MTNSVPVVSKGGYTRAGLGVVYFDFVQHITPPLAGYLNMRYPILGDAVSYEIVCLIEASIGGILIKLTPSHFSDTIKNAIISVKTTFKMWRDAWNETP